MNNFNDLYMCDFSKSDIGDLVNKIVEHYKKTENMASKDAAIERLNLSIWWRCNGYTSEDYRMAKSIASGIRY